MKTVRKFVSTLLIGGAALTLSTHSFSTEATVTYGADGRPSTTISVRDLDLSKPNDVQELYRRVQHGARPCANRSCERRGARETPCRSIGAGSAFDPPSMRRFGASGIEWLTALHGGAPELIAGRK